MSTLAVLNVLIGVNSRKFDRSIKQMQYKLRRTGRELKGVGEALSKGFTVPLLAGGLASIKMSSDFESAMSKVEGLVGVARGQTEAWRGDLLKMAKEVGRTPRALADGLFFVTSAGLEGAQALNALRAAAQASAAGLGSIDTVADAVTSAMNAYGAATLSAGDATGILVAAVREGKASAESIAPALGKVIPIASALGVGFDQVAASIATMTRLGSSASESATALRGILKTLVKPSEETKKALASVGFSAEGLRKKIREEGLLSVLDGLKKAFKGNEEGLARVFSETEGYIGVLNLVGTNAEQTKEIFEELAGATRKDLADAFETAADTSAFKFNQALASINASLIRFGDVVTPSVLPVLEALTGIIDRVSTAFSSLSPNTQQFVLGIAAIFAAAGPLLIALGFIATALGTIGIATVGWVAGIAAGAALVIANWDVIKGAAGKLVAFLQPAFAQLSGLFGEIGTMLKEWAVDIWPMVQKVAVAAAQKIAAIWAEHGEKILAVIRLTWPLVRGIILTTLDIILSTVALALQVLTGDWAGAWNTMKESLVGMVPHVLLAFLHMKVGFASLAIGIGTSVLKILLQLSDLGKGFLALPFLDPGTRAVIAAGLGGLEGAINVVGIGIAGATNTMIRWKGEADSLRTTLAGTKIKMVEMQSDWVTVSAGAAASASQFKNSYGSAIEVISSKTGELAAKLSGGFGRAAEEGASGVKKVYTDLQSWMLANPLKVPLDSEHFQRQLRDFAMMPDTSGELP